MHDHEEIGVCGYSFYGNSRQTSRASGGVGILVKNEVYTNYLATVCCTDTDGILAIKLTHKRTGSESVVVCNYLPPASSAYGKDSEGFFDKLLVLSYEQSDCEMVLYCGDFNARIGSLHDTPKDGICKRHCIDKTVNSHGHALLSFLNDNDCCILNGRFGHSKYTCMTYNGSSVVDYIITHSGMLKNIVNFSITYIEDLIHELKLEPHILDGGLPDHNLLSVTFRSSGLYVEDVVRGLGVVNKRPSRRIPRKFRSTYMNTDRFHRILTTILDKVETVDDSQNQIDALYSEICDVISAEMTLHCKKKKRKNTAVKPYWNQQLSDLWKDMRIKYTAARSKLRGKSRRQLLREEHSDNIVHEFKIAVKKFDYELRAAKRKHNTECIDSLDKLVDSRNPKIFWDEVNKLGPRKKNIVTCEALDLQGNITRDPVLVLQHWEGEYRRLYSEAPMGDFDDSFYIDKLVELEELDPDLNPTVNLNIDITRNEVKRAICAGKKNKACGNDNIPYEAIQNEHCIELMHRLFVLCFRNGLIPGEWSKCLIVPISKGDRSISTQPLTFRGLALQSCVYKCYSHLLNKRLDSYLESNNMISNKQNGFRRGRNCVDHIYSLSETIRLNTGSPRQKVYACFFDMRRAFDEVDRNLLLLRLQKVGVNGNMYRAMSAIYQSPQCRVKLGDSGMTTSWIDSNYGTLQGDVISPKNFSIVIDQLLQELNESGLGLYYGPNPGDRFACLAFADDLVVVAPTESQLQKLVSMVHSFCKLWRMSVNTDKTKTMVFRKNMQTKNENIAILYGDKKLEQVKQYKYLGIIFDETLRFGPAHEALAASGGRALGAIISKSKRYNDIGYKSYTKLIDTCVNSVTDYCSEIIGHDTPKGIIDIQLRAARFHLGVPKTTSLCCLASEMGWLPAPSRRQMCVLRYYNKLMRMDVSRIPRRTFESTVNTPNSWAWKTRDLLISLGLDLYWNMGSPVPMELIQFYIREDSKDKWRSQLAAKEKLRVYKKVKLTMCVSPYVAANVPRKQRSLIARLVCGCLRLRVETGRYSNELFAERSCTVCTTGETEDEEHFLLRCPAYDDLRAGIVGQNMSLAQLLRQPFILGKLIQKLWSRRCNLMPY